MVHRISHHLALAIHTHYSCLKTTGRYTKANILFTMQWPTVCVNGVPWDIHVSLPYVLHVYIVSTRTKRMDMRKANGTWRGSLSSLNEIKGRLTVSCLYGHREREASWIYVYSYDMLLEGHDSSSTMLHKNKYVLPHFYKARSQN
jgi:hypothetical protein